MSVTTFQHEFDNPYEAYLELGMELEWTMRDFTEIKIKDMEDSHIANCIRMLNKNLVNDIKTSRHYWIQVFEDVQLKRRIYKINKLKNNINGI